MIDLRIADSVATETASSETVLHVRVRGPHVCESEPRVSEKPRNPAREMRFPAIRAEATTPNPGRRKALRIAALFTVA